MTFYRRADYQTPFYAHITLLKYDLFHSLGNIDRDSVAFSPHNPEFTLRDSSILGNLASDRSTVDAMACQLRLWGMVWVGTRLFSRVTPARHAVPWVRPWGLSFGLTGLSVKWRIAMNRCGKKKGKGKGR